MTNKQTILIIEDEKHIGNYMETKMCIRDRLSAIWSGLLIMHITWQVM